MRLEALGEKYPFLQANLPFWERYLRSRDEVDGLLSEMLGAADLEASLFWEDMHQGKPLLAYGTVRLSAAGLNALSRTFCRSMGLPYHPVELPTPLPLHEDLSVAPDTNGFVAAEVHAAIAAWAENAVAGDKEINWLEPFCPICGAPAAMGLITPAGKKNLICSHCQSVWVYLRTACGRCGHSPERGSTFFYADEEPDWFIEVCEACGHYLKVADMRDRLPEIVSYPLYYLTTWELDLAIRNQGFAPSFFDIFYRAGWLQLAKIN